MQDPIEILLDKGYEQYEAGAFGEALVLFTKASKLDSKNPETYFLRGLAYHGLEGYQEPLQRIDRG